MTVFRRCFVDVLRRLAVPAVAVLALTAMGGRLAHPDRRGDPVDTATAWWLLPIVALSAAMVAATVDAWPMLGHDRPGATHLRRLPLGPLDGCAAAMLAGAAALAVVLAPSIVALELALGRDPGRGIVAAVAAEPVDGSRLDAGSRTVRFELPGRPALDAISLRPVALWSGAPMTTAWLEIAVDGEPIATVAIEPPGHVVRVPVSQRRAAELTVRRAQPGGMRLWFPRESVHALATTDVSPLTNALGVAAVAVLSAFCAFALTLPLRRWLGAPVVFCLAVGTLVVATATAIAPTAPALEAVARDRWFLDPATSRAAGTSLSAALLAMLCAMVVGRGKPG